MIPTRKLDITKISHLTKNHPRTMLSRVNRVMMTFLSKSRNHKLLKAKKRKMLNQRSLKLVQRNLRKSPLKVHLEVKTESCSTWMENI